MVPLDVKTARAAVYNRGLIINRYSAIEFAVAELVSRASIHAAYSRIGLPPFGPAKKLKRLRQMIRSPGPIARFDPELTQRLDEFKQYEEHRNFMAHAIMVPKNADAIEFKMYDHKEGVYSVGELTLTLLHMDTLAGLLSPMSQEMAGLVSRICREVPFAAV